MAWRRVLWSFPARAACFLFLLLLPLPGVEPAFCRAVAAWQTAVLSDPPSLVSLEFRLPRSEAEGGPWHIVVIARERDTKRYVGTALDARRAGYLQCAGFVALLLATPTSRKKKLLLLLLGGFCLAVLPLLAPLAFFSTPSLGLQAFRFNPLLRSAIEIAYRVLVAAPGMAYAVPALLWLGLVRWLDPELLFSSSSSNRAASTQDEPGSARQSARS